MRQPTCILTILFVLVGGVGCEQAPEELMEPWTLSDLAREHVTDPVLEARISQALDAAASVGTDPSISKFVVRAATVIEYAGIERAIVGGNSEYAGYPEAIHGETSLMNHVINVVGPESARRDVEFIAFYNEGRCSDGGSCGDCRDYLMTTTAWRHLLIACGQAADHTVHIHRFAEEVVPEEDFPEVARAAIGLPKAQLDELVRAALEARAGGVSLFTSEREQLGVAALTTKGEIYRAAGADDAAFHYRYPIGAALQQAATYRDYFVQAIVVVGAPGHIPRVSYRDRQYGYEFSSFNGKRGLPPIELILVEQAVEVASDAEPPPRRYRLTTFEEALPGAFSAASFVPEAVERFLDDRAEP